MATAVDPVRRTLDTLALDPSAATDRPYLESMLRRLGYSEHEIRAALHGAPRHESAGGAPADSEDRIIEVEYTGAGTKEFLMVVGVDESELASDPLGLGTGLEAGTEVFEGGPSMEEVDRLVAEGTLSDFDDWGEGGPREDAAGAEEISAAPTTEELMEGAATGDVGGAEPAKPGEGGSDFKGKKDETQYQIGEGLVEFKPAGLNEAVIETVDPAAEAEKLRAEGWTVGDPTSGEFPPEQVDETWEAGSEPEALAEGTESTSPAQAGAAADQTWEAKETAFQYGDWMLYKRDELKGDQPQRVYFFSKGTPEGSDPAPLPDGYEVAENVDTGRPFLRRSGSPGPSYSPEVEAAHPSADPRSGGAKKRVRILRVRAATREEAIAKLQAEGRNVIASMPIDIEKKLR
ncbi:MAG: hypothetical protein V4510_04115 [bacterium]